MPDLTVTTVEQQPNYAMVRIQVERLDDTNVDLVRADASAVAADSPQLPVVLDMAKVRFMPSFSLSGLVRLTQEFKARGQRLVITGLQPFVRETIIITRLDQVFDIQDDLSTIKRQVDR
jgi:anti-anti-sigma factor